MSSGQGIYIKQTTGDLILGNIAAGNDIQLAATGSIYAEAGFTDRSAIHILGANLDLRAGGSIGFNGSTCQLLQVNISGAVTGSAVGDLSILAVTGDLARRHERPLWGPDCGRRPDAERCARRAHHQYRHRQWRPGCSRSPTAA